MSNDREVRATADQFDREEPWTDIRIQLKVDGVWLTARLGTTNSTGCRTGAVKLTDVEIASLEALLASYRQRSADPAPTRDDPFNVTDLEYLL